jgi:hypothetical protein
MANNMGRDRYRRPEINEGGRDKGIYTASNMFKDLGVKIASDLGMVRGLNPFFCY